MPYSTEEKAAVVIVGFITLAALVIAIVALVFAVQNRNGTNKDAAFMAMTCSATGGQLITGGVQTTVSFWDTTLGTASGFTYADGKFIATKAGIYSFVGNIAVNVSGTGGAADPPSPLTAWVKKDNGSVFYGVENSVPLDNSVVSGNSQYIQWSTMLHMAAGEGAYLQVLSGTDQILLDGAYSYAAIGTPVVTC